MTIFTPEFSVVWFEIPVSNLKKSTAFYEAVLQTKLQESEMGSGPVMIFPVADSDRNPSGMLFQSDSVNRSEMVIHLAAPHPLDAAMKRLHENGGEVVSGKIPIPAGEFAYCRDIDGNRISLFCPVSSPK